jgi:hypothetical protein
VCYTGADPAHDDAIKSLIENYGTHFISSVTVGNKIFQVFSYSKEKFNIIAQKYGVEVLTGFNVASFSEFTTVATPTNTRGHALQAGSLLCASGNAIFRDSVAAGRWRDDFGLDSFFTHKNVVDLLDHLQRDVVPIRLGITNLGGFLRGSKLWDRVLNGSLVARFGSAVKPPLEKAVVPADIANTYKPTSTWVCSRFCHSLIKKKYPRPSVFLSFVFCFCCTTFTANSIN